MSVLLGIDEGTSAVKAVLFDEDLRPLKEARRDKLLRYPRRRRPLGSWPATSSKR